MSHYRAGAGAERRGNCAVTGGRVSNATFAPTTRHASATTHATARIDPATRHTRRHGPRPAHPPAAPRSPDPQAAMNGRLPMREIPHAAATFRAADPFSRILEDMTCPACGYRDPADTYRLAPGNQVHFFCDNCGTFVSAQHRASRHRQPDPQPTHQEPDPDPATNAPLPEPRADRPRRQCPTSGSCYPARRG